MKKNMKHKISWSCPFKLASQQLSWFLEPQLLSSFKKLHSCCHHKLYLGAWLIDYIVPFGSTAALLFKLRSQVLSLSVRGKSFKKKVLRNCTVNVCTYVHIFQSFPLSRTLYCTVYRRFFFFLTHYLWIICCTQKWMTHILAFSPRYGGRYGSEKRNAKKSWSII